MPDNLPYDEKELLLKIAEGNEQAMRILFRSFYSRLCFLAAQLLGNEHQSEDMAQESLSAFWERRENFRTSSMKEVSAFLFTIVRNRCFNYLKHLKVKEAKQNELIGNVAEFENLVEAQIVKEDLYYLIYLEIQSLSDTQRQVLNLIFFEGLDTEEIAKKLGTTPNNVRNQKARALEKLRSVLLRKGLSTSFFYVFIELL